MSTADLSAFYTEAAALEARLDAAKDKRAAEKAGGGLTAETRDELEDAAAELHAFRSYWRQIGFVVRNLDDSGDFFVKPGPSETDGGAA